MRKHFIYITLSLLSFIAFSQEEVTESLKNECNPNIYLDSCKTKIQDDHFTNIKNFFIENKDQTQVEHSFTFTEGTSYEYYFTGYQEGNQQVIASLLNGKKKVLATNEANDKYLHKISFYCKKTDIYYIQFKFLDNETYCGAGVLGFTKKSTKKKK